MKKLFISQPMRGLSDEEILAERDRIHKAAEQVSGEKYEVIPSFIEGRKFDKKNIAVRYLSESIMLLSDADVAVFGSGWESARGCKIEHQICQDYDIKIIDISPKGSIRYI